VLDVGPSMEYSVGIFYRYMVLTHIAKVRRTEITKLAVSWIKGRERHRPRSLSTLHSARSYLLGTFGFLLSILDGVQPPSISTRGFAFCFLLFALHIVLFHHHLVALPRFILFLFDIRRPKPMATSTSDSKR
jgi:hypothetical protein